MSNKSRSEAYAAAGVDVTAGYESVELIKSHVKRTTIPGVIGGIGGFGGMFELAANEYKNPVLVSGTDGCGTKVKLAFLMDKHDTIGIDAVAMCVNDVVCAGGEPLFFLDYIAVDKVDSQKVANIVKGVANACKESGCALIGGETAIPRNYCFCRLFYNCTKLINASNLVMVNNFNSKIQFKKK